MWHLLLNQMFLLAHQVAQAHRYLLHLKKILGFLTLKKLRHLQLCLPRILPLEILLSHPRNILLNCQRDILLGHPNQFRTRRAKVFARGLLLLSNLQHRVTTLVQHISFMIQVTSDNQIGKINQSTLVEQCSMIEEFLSKANRIVIPVLIN